MPFRSEVVVYINQWRLEKKGPVLLISASPDIWIKKISDHLQIFDLAIGSSSNENLKGTVKMDAIRKTVQGQPFTYIGDSNADLSIWQFADGILAVNPKPSVKTKILDLNTKTQFIDDKPPPLSIVSQTAAPAPMR